ncbi:MAG: fused MFS/spermidine synthase [Ahrensia sp.]|nr:fused MFS/spermidine synthase [Ahrensia sp.]
MRPASSAAIRLAMMILLAAAVAFCSSVSARELIESRESTYNNIYVHKDGPIYAMSFGHNRRFYTETIYDSRDELVLPVVYTRFMTAGLAYLGKPASSLLEIGFGGGRTAWYLHKHFPDLDITSVELDPEVLELAIKYFGVSNQENFDVQVADGRRYMQRQTDRRWDIIMVDAYRGPFVPFHLLTTEFYALAKRRLSDGGVLVQNVEPTTMVFEAALKTVGSVFANVDLYPAQGNVVMVAYDGPSLPRDILLQRAEAVTKSADLRYPLQDMLAERRIVNRLPETPALTDDFAPVESLLAIERHNRKLDDYAKP